jgi:histone-lysine N-methyltransferase SETMAR
MEAANSYQTWVTVSHSTSRNIPEDLNSITNPLSLYISSTLLRNAEVIDRVITNDETWCFQYDPETKRQSMQWKTQTSPRPKKARLSRSQVKTMLVCFFDHKRIVHCEFIAQGQTVNQQCYLEVLTRLRESVRRNRPGLWPDKWTLHRDNAPAHDALTVREFLAKNSITKMDHPPYSPHLAPCDFWLLPKFKKCPEGTEIC